MPTERQEIDYGASANDGTGDPLRVAFIKTDDNFAAIWAAGPVGSNVVISDTTVSTVATNANLVLSPNGIGIIRTDSAVIPRFTNTSDLGSPNLRYRTVYVGTGGANILGNLSVSGATSFTGDVAFPGNVTVGANLTVQGDIIQVGNIVTDTLTIQLANTAATDAAANGAGITVGAADDIATLLYDSDNNVWTTNIGVTVNGAVSGTALLVSDATVYGNVSALIGNYTGNVTADYFIGNGSQLTGLPEGYANADAVSYAESGWAGNIIPAGNGVYSLGNATNYWSNLWVANNTIYIGGVPLGVSGNVLTVDGQPVLSNDSSSSITTTGNITAGNVTAGIVSADYVQFLDGSSLTESYISETGFIVGSNNSATLATLQAQDVRVITDFNGGAQTWTFGSAGDLTAPGNITADYFIGDGSQLTNLPVDPTIIVNGTSQIDIPVANSNIYVGVAGQGSTEFTAEGINTLNLASLGNIIGVTANISGNTTTNNLVVTNFADIGDLSLAGGYITLVDGSASTGIDISPNPEGQAFLQVPNDATANTANLRVVNNAGNVRIETNAGTIWTFGYDGNLTAPGNVSANAILTDNYFYANGEPFSSGANIGNLEVTGTTIGIAAGAGESTITVGNASAGLTVNPDSELAAAKLYAYSTAQDFFSQGGDYTSGTYTAGGIGGVITLTGATIVEDYLNASQYTIVSVTINGTDTVPYDSGGWGSGTVTVNTTTPPSVNPTTVTDIEFNTQFENRIVLDIDAGDYGIYIGDHNFDIQSVRDIRITSGDDFSIESDDGFDLRSRSTTGGIDLITDYGNSQQTWQFRYDGTLITPGDITVAGDITGTASASTLVLAAEPNSNTAIQLNDSVDSIIRTVANLEISTDVSGTSKTWTFDTTGDLSAPGNISVTGNITTGNILTDGYYYANGSPFTPGSNYGDSNVVSLLSAFGSNSITTTGNVTADNFIGNISITGNVTGTSANVDLVAGSYTWSFNDAGNLVLPGNTFAVNYANGTAVQLGGAGDYGDSNVVSLLSSFGSNTISTTGNVTAGIVDSSGTIYGNIDLILGDVANASATKTRLVSFGASSYIQTGNGTTGSTGNIVFSPYLDATEKVVINTGTGDLTALGNVTADNVLLSGNITGSAANVTITANSFVTTFDTTGTATFPGDVTVTGNLFATGTDGNVVTRFESTWTVPTGNSTQSFTVDGNHTYQMWVEGNIPNGIIAWNALVTVTNTNVPVLGQQFAWNYEGGGNVLLLTSIPNQIIGTAGAISNAAPAVSNTNTFSFGINNASGSEQTVRYGWIRVS